jgi:hypothetical protein
MKRRRKTSRPRWQPKPGHMFFYNEEVPIEEAERHAKMMMGKFDSLPRKIRDLINEGHTKRRRTKW